MSNFPRMHVSFLMLLSLSISCSQDFPGNSARTGAQELSTTTLNTPRLLEAKTTFGVATVDHRYNPFGIRDAHSIVRSAQDMQMLGFQSIKLWLDSGPVNRLTSPKLYNDAEKPAVKQPVDLLRHSVYRKILDLDFKTHFFVMDNFFHNNIDTTRAPSEFSEDDRRQIYEAAYGAAKHLLETYKSTKKTFVLQNHEGDWHLVERIRQDTPTELALKKAAIYFTERQRAIDDARKKYSVADGPEIYHMCEITDVVRPMESDFPALINKVLPHVTCDLIGYSAYDSALDTDKNKFLDAMKYIKSKALPSPFFGTNQVAISEVGYPENKEPFKRESTEAAIRASVDMNVPFVLMWTAYDNECGSYHEPAAPRSSASNTCSGFHMRKPDRGLSSLYENISQYLNLSPENYVTRAYRFYHDRAPTSADLEFWSRSIRELGLVSVDRDIGQSPEAKKNLVKMWYQTILNREPDENGLNFWAKKLLDSSEWGLVANDFLEGGAHEPGSVADFLNSAAASAPAAAAPAPAPAATTTAPAPSLENTTAGPSTSNSAITTSPLNPAPTCPTVLPKNQPLPKGTKICSPNGKYFLVLQNDGNLVAYVAAVGRAYWAAHTTNGTQAMIQSDGNLIVFDSQSKPVWASNTGGRSADLLALQNDGNLVVYNQSGQSVWASNTGNNP